MNMSYEYAKISQELKKKYPKGTRVELVYMDDPYSKIPEGTLGTVKYVDDMATIHISWDNGSSLGAAYGEDEIRTAFEGEEPFVACSQCKTKIKDGDMVWHKGLDDFCSEECALRYYGIVQSIADSEFF